MKKIIFSLLMFLCLPIWVDAADYKITDFLIDSNILENGDLEVNELIVLKGTFNGYERDINYANSALVEGSDFANNNIYNASDITNMTIKAKYVNNVSFDTFKELDYTPFTMVNSASLKDKGKYILSNLNEGYRYRMYYPSDNEKVAFYLKYIVKNVVVMHNDVAELYWTFVPNGFEDDINNIQIRVSLPSSDFTDNFRIWAHGNLSGEVNKIENRGIEATINKVMSKESVDIRTTFDKSLITNTYNIKRSNQNALEKIIEVETKRADVANELRKELLAKYNFIKYSSLLLLLAIVALWIFIYFKYDKERKSTYYSKYNREFIDDYNVEVIDYLMNKKISPNAMSASIMNLIYKKNISAKELATDKKKKEYEFTLENTTNANESELILLEFLFDKVGKETLNADNKKVFTTLDLKKYASGTKTCDKFIASYTKWKNNVLALAKKEKFFENPNVPKLISLIIAVISFVIFAIGINYGVDYIPSYLLPFVAIIFLIYGFMVEKKTTKGIEHYTRWNAFKNFLNDFGAFDIKELPEIILWERYLVYATIFGLAKNVQKSMNVKIKELEMNNLDYDYYPSFVYLNLGNTINSSINSAISNAYQSQAANYANSHSSSSSGSGFGGGFSSGGGFGGGGGGGRGF